MIDPIDAKPVSRRKKQMQVRIHDQLRAQLEALVARNASSLTTEIMIAVRARLESYGLWPPPQKPR